MNIDDLNAEIARKGLTKPQLAERLGVSKKCLYSRLKGETSFKQEEIQKIASILGLDEEKIMNKGEEVDASEGSCSGRYAE